MKAAVVGCGAMGAAAVRALLVDPTVEWVLAIDRDSSRLRAVTDALGDSRLRICTDDAGGREGTAALRRCDVIGTALSWFDALPATTFALEHGVPVVGIGRPPSDPRELLGSAARRAPAVLGTGLEPGLTEVLARRVLAREAGVTQLRTYCGGVPVHPRPPLRHVSWFGPARLPRPRATYMLRRGRLTRCARFSGVEHVRAPGVGTLEAYHDGMLPWLGRDPVFGALTRMDQKTLRWPGFAHMTSSLHALGLLEDQPVQVGGTTVVPADVVDALLEPMMSPSADDRDVTMLAVEGADQQGRWRGGSHALVEMDTDCGSTGMALLTGTMLAATMAALGHADASGVVHPWELFADDDAVTRLLPRLARSGIQVVDDDRRWLGRRPE